MFFLKQLNQQSENASFWSVSFPISSESYTKYYFTFIEVDFFINMHDKLIVKESFTEYLK
jgi:hypothetical protein